MIVYCATSNAGKLREFQAAGEGFDVRRLRAEIPSPEEHGLTFEENAVAKAEYYGRFEKGFLFAEDSGLEVDSLGGEPGVYSARYAGPNPTDEENNARLLARLEGVNDHDRDRLARFVCVVALVKDGALVKTFGGAVEGRIIDRPRGANGFGYDPLFYYEPFGCTFGEATLAEKMNVSHRGQALAQMFGYLEKQG